MEIFFVFFLPIKICWFLDRQLSKMYKKEKTLSSHSKKEDSQLNSVENHPSSSSFEPAQSTYISNEIIEEISKYTNKSISLEDMLNLSKNIDDDEFAKIIKGK